MRRIGRHGRRHPPIRRDDGSTRDCDRSQRRRAGHAADFLASRGFELYRRGSPEIRQYNMSCGYYGAARASAARPRGGNHRNRGSEAIATLRPLSGSRTRHRARGHGSTAGKLATNVDRPNRTRSTLYFHRLVASDPVLSPLVILRTPTDIFPNINIPVIAVVWTYTGLNPEELEGRLTTSTSGAHDAGRQRPAHRIDQL